MDKSKQGKKGELKEIAETCMGELIQEFRRSAKLRTNLRPEHVMQGYLLCKLMFKVGEKFRDLVQREYTTKLFYHRPSGIHEGFECGSEKHNELVKEKKGPRRGEIDLVILDPDEKFLNVKPQKQVPKALIGIEVEYPPKNRWSTEEEFKNHIERDWNKLTNQQNEIDFKYLLCFSDKKLSIDFEKLLDGLKSEEKISGELNFAYIEAEESTLIPERWLKL